ncbi:hypothetical protein Taro_039001 [Colocasia esculenta]|uniref:Histone acetyltransferase n=1 Tax=Colocasia esculenta TaxID=4460 RepID=A0A843WUD0_COLES|nr:hypothetical protein [Colocasia esculenta]
MPRPGPRPYECVKRAWHSDRHQPVRGSLIREIFRIANEIHSPATRKNKEWQEKLPSVVLKAEEIMYSKANSEGEYVDLRTLWERANDAVDTIIRRDDVNESGDLLQPCIEAALTLGCIPRRASRSQRHSNPRCYLTSSPEEAAKPPPASHTMLHSNRPQMGPAAYLLQSPLLGCPGSLQDCRTQSTPWMPGPSSAPHGCHLEMAYPSAALSINQNEALPASCTAFRYRSDDSPLCKQGKTMLETLKQATMGRVYPLYYATITQNVESCSSFLEPVGSSCNGVTVGSAPCGSSVRELDVQVFPGDGNGYTTLNDPSNLRDVSESTANAECDLSLHLGLPSTIPLAADEGWVPEVEDMGSSSSLDGSKFHEPSQSQPRTINFGCPFLSPQNHKGMLLSYMEGPSEPLESCSSKRSLEDEDTLYVVETSDRKRKALHDDSLDYGYLRWKLTHSAGQEFYTSERLDS